MLRTTPTSESDSPCAVMCTGVMTMTPTMTVCEHTMASTANKPRGSRTAMRSADHEPTGRWRGGRWSRYASSFVGRYSIGGGVVGPSSIGGRGRVGGRGVGLEHARLRQPQQRGDEHRRQREHRAREQERADERWQPEH